MTLNEEVVVVTNRITKIISSMEIDETISDGPKEGQVNKEFIQKVLESKLDAEDFLKKLDELKELNNNILLRINRPDMKNSRKILENNGVLIDQNIEKFSGLLNKINSMLDQLKLNKKLSGLINLDEN